MVIFNSMFKPCMYSQKASLLLWGCLHWPSFYILTSCALYVLLKLALQTGSGLMESVALPHHRSNEMQAAVRTAGTVACVSVFHSEQSRAPQRPGISCAVEKSQCHFIYHFTFSICFFSLKVKKMSGPLWVILLCQAAKHIIPHCPKYE